MMPVHPPGRPLHAMLAEDTEKSLAADRLGFEELWLGEHFSATSEPIPSPLIFMAGLVPRTRNLRFGTGVICLPHHDPVIVAAEVAQFDHMSEGRLMLGVGPGGPLSDFELFRHTDVVARNRMVIESVRIMRQIWSQDPPYDIKGEFWNVSLKTAIMPELGVGYMPKPFQPGGPPISLSLASPNSSAARPAAVQGWSILSANIIPTYSVGPHPTAISTPTSVPRSAASGSSRSSSRTPPCPTRRRPPRSLPKAASSTAPPGPCSTSSSPSATRSGRSGRCS